MPTLQAKTVSAKEIWKSPDGQKTIWEVQIDVEGHTYSAKTYSKAIAQIGWSGTVESYEKAGRNGSETFVKQKQQEQSYQGKSSQQPKNEFTMYLAYVKDIAVALINAGKSLDELPAIVEQVALEGKHLYSLREGAPDTNTASEPTYKPIDADEVDINAEMNKLFPDKDEEWKKTIDTLPV